MAKVDGHLPATTAAIFLIGIGGYVGYYAAHAEASLFPSYG